MLWEVSEKLNKTLVQAGSLADDNRIFWQYVLNVERKIIDMNLRKAVLECSHERATKIEFKKVEEQWDQCNGKIGDRFALTCTKDDPDTYVSWRGKNGLCEGCTKEYFKNTFEILTIFQFSL